MAFLPCASRNNSRGKTVETAFGAARNRREGLATQLLLTAAHPEGIHQPKRAACGQTATPVPEHRETSGANGPRYHRRISAGESTC